jgi:hypothetical protein
MQRIRYAIVLGVCLAAGPTAWGQVVGGVMSVTQSHMS